MSKPGLGRFIEGSPRARRRLLSLLGGLLGAALVAAMGAVLIRASLAAGTEGVRKRTRSAWMVVAFSEGLARLSYDLLFVLRGSVPPAEACIVYFDEGSARALGEPLDPWNRALHARLVRRLTADGARAVLFDIVFSDPWPVPAVDEEFAAALKENGRTFLGAALELDEGRIGAIQQRTIPPTALLRRAAAGWGLLAFRPVDPDYAVRRIYPGLETVPTATWVAAGKLGARLPPQAADASRRPWMNYYGPADHFLSVSYERALAPLALPPDFFRDRIVVVGGRSTLGALRMGKDDFRSPYGVLGGDFCKGPEVHLTALLNLLHGDWLERVSPPREIGLALLFGALLGGSLGWLRPHFAVLGAAIAFAGVLAIATWLIVAEGLWFCWGVLAFVQVPVALIWAVGTRYFIEERRRNALRDAFAHYLSPRMADQIADADFDLSLGGTVVEATVMFTDLENFTPLSEELGKPELISEILTTYFTQTTGHILENDGTIVKYLGDAVQAVWGAPLPDADHARKAVFAAWRLHEASVMEVQGHPLRTRIGVNTGMMLSGNLGSAQRFDYATTGDEVNFASRLEGLNKYLGTHVLISDSVKERVGDAFFLRCVGEFRVVGKKAARVIYELLGPEPASERHLWIESFARGLDAFRAGDFTAAEAAMRETIATRGADGPSSFYLERIDGLRDSALPPDWKGIVELSAK